jgi:hypothetical protein
MVLFGDVLTRCDNSGTSRGGVHTLNRLYYAVQYLYCIVQYSVLYVARTKRRRTVAGYIFFIVAILTIAKLGHFQPRLHPQPPFVQVCPHEAVSFFHGSGFCSNGQASTLYLDGFADLDLLINNGDSWGSTMVRLRVYKSDASGEHLYGTAVSSNLDPTWTGVVWSLQPIWDYLTLTSSTGSAHIPPDPGQYRIEVLDHAGRYLTATRLNLQWSRTARQTATPVDQNGS